MPYSVDDWPNIANTTNTLGVGGFPVDNSPILARSLMRNEVQPTMGAVSTLQAAVGIKVNVAKTVLIGAGLIMGLSEGSGLHDNVSFGASLEYSF